MAVSVAGVAPARGALVRLWVLRLAFTLAAALPAWMAAKAGFEGGVALRPFFAGGTAPLPMVMLVRLVTGLSPAVGPLLLLAAVAMALADQFLTAAALLVLDGRAAEPARAVRSAGQDGARYIYRFTRILLYTVVLGGVGAGLIGFALRRVVRHGREAGWSGIYTDMLLPLAIVVLCTLWFALVASCGLWTRAVTVMADRRCARRSAALVLRAWWHRPGAALAVFVLLLAAALAPVPFLLYWRHAGPWPRGAVLALVAVSLVLQALLAALWLWILAFIRSRLAAPALGSLWQTPDEPYRPLRRLLARWRARRARAIPPQTPPPEPPPAPPDLS